MSEIIHISKVVFALFGKERDTRNVLIGRVLLLRMDRYRRQKEQANKFNLQARDRLAAMSALLADAKDKNVEARKWL